MGIQINWQELLTKGETYFIVVIISLAAILLWLLFVKVFSKKIKMYWREMKIRFEMKTEFSEKTHTF